MTPRVYIDGHVGTTGLRIRQWLAERKDLELTTLADDRRKDAAAREAAVAEADVAVLCLPDAAAREAAAWAQTAGTPVVDASTAHRVAEGWVFGLPELAPGQREAIAGARRVANPGCYAQAFILLVRPLVDAGCLDPASPLTIHAISGYTGGGRGMIERWEDPAQGLADLPYPAPYALERVHKHVPEMVEYARVAHEPQFLPSVGAFPCGMRVEVPLHARLLDGRPARALHEALADRYRGETFVRVAPFSERPEPGERGLDPRACNDTNRIELHVLPHPSGHALLVAILDNLGKGACGNAIQSVNLLLGLPEGTGLPV
jgi:N-acetyl-gamma-glutamyl-phosphate reductase